MARITVEDCPQTISRFELVAYAAERGKQLNAGAPNLVPLDNDKIPVVALRELAKRVVNLDDMREGIIRRMRQQVEVEEAEEEVIDFMNEEVAAIQQSSTYSENVTESGFSEQAEEELDEEEDNTDEEIIEDDDSSEDEDKKS